MMRVLVTGATSPVGRNLIDQLSLRGLDVLGADPQPSPRADGIQVLETPAVGDPYYLSQLVELVAGHHVDLLLPTLCAELHVIAAARHLPQAVVGSLEAVVAAGDKWLTTRLLASAGVAVPLSAQGWQVSRTVAEVIGAPFIVKPRIGCEGQGVRLLTEWPQDHSLGSCELVCEYIPGPEYSVCVFVGDQPADDVAVPVSTRGRDGTTLADAGATVVEDPAVAGLALTACRALGLLGPAEVDIRRRRSGRPVVLEVNAHIGAHIAHAPPVLDAVLAKGHRSAAIGA
ncbi:ATP-grasp domain-containing protein [Tessaracoccus sp. OS52]|uniref:ATP-grasp domain-containing protein n=1 Tax=Tessaracoccus sp. OS52 TaxID=2886691 RepID=UPI001D126DF5|nr:ATP-grasp domain-containing protein [Tessaracoccus sp. OS52]MCC2593884.1 ATP-grasp domain-containing protein [Tessaracoccus sp. OS52]